VFQLSVPQVIQIGVQGYCVGESFLCQNGFHAHLDVGGALYPLSPSSRSFGMFSVEAGGRVFPWNSTFFMLLDLGYRRLNVAADLSFLRVEGAILASSASVEFSTFYFTPGIGLSFALGESWKIEMDLGVQIPLLASGQMFFLNQNTGQNSNNSTLLESNSDLAMSRIAGLILPHMTLARLIHYF
jgi:hypothetical protein